MDRIELRRALVSVYDKTGLDKLGRALAEAGVAIVSTGSTAQYLRQAGCQVTEVAELTGFPECLDGRVKTLHPKVHAGILADRRLESHIAQLEELGIESFDLVVCNLYPFAQTVASGAGTDQCIEQIDIGGPALVRAGAKNHPSVAVLTSPDQYPGLYRALSAGGYSLAERQQLAKAAFIQIAEYDIAVANWLTETYPRPAEAESPNEARAALAPALRPGTGALRSGMEALRPGTGTPRSGTGDQSDAATAPRPGTDSAATAQAPALRPGAQQLPAGSAAAQIDDAGFPEWLAASWRRQAELRYGENSHQGAALYLSAATPGLAQARQLQGKAMSYNNYTDADAAYRAAADFELPAVAIIKHANPCGIAVGSDLAEAHRLAHACDPLSAYGGVIACNGIVSSQLAEQIAPIFTEVVIASGYEPAALEILGTKANLRLLEVPPYPRVTRELRPISGGLLVQTPDRIDAAGDDPANWQLMAGPAADTRTLADLVFAWRACRAVKSNAILLARGGAAVGIGMGQVNRVDSCRLAVERAGDRAQGSVAASDAFFPFADGPKILLQAGIRAIVEPGGSIRDQETIEACQAAGVTLYFTATRHFYH